MPKTDIFRSNWYNIELNKNQWFILRDFLQYGGYRYEPSQCGDLVHIEIFIPTEKDFQTISEFLIFLPD